MNRKLLFVNVVLLGLLILGVAELIRRIRIADERYSMLETLPAKEAPAYPAPEAPRPVRPGEYMPVVDRLLFSEDRNPIVEVEEPPKPVVERPELPLLVGVMNLGEGPIAMMSATSGGAPRPVMVGEKVGEFTFLGASGDKVVLEWAGQKIEVGESELVGAAGSAPKAKPRAPRTSSARASSKTNLAGDKRKSISKEYYIGAPLSGQTGRRAADPTDGVADGTEANGWVRRVRQTPFGAQHWWEKKEE